MINLFGSGTLWGTPTQDAVGNAIATPTPVLLGVLQDCSVDFSFDTKMLYGQTSFPVAVGRGKGKISGKAKFAQINTTMLNALLFGLTSTAQVFDDVYDVTGTTISGTTATPTIPNSGTWATDLGVRDANGVPFKRTISAPAAGQYSVSAGVYTFSASDTGKLVFISYQYTATSTVAQKTTVISQPFGPVPTFRADLSIGSANGKKFVLTLPNCVSSKFSLATKQDDFIIPEFDFEAFADGTGVAAYYGASE